jgi:CHAT domain-containing protein
MSVPRFLFLILAAGFAVSLAQAQDAAGILNEEDDERVTTLEERQRATSTLLKRANELRNSGHAIEAARNLNRAGGFQIRLYLRDDALGTFREALKLLKQQPDVETHIDSLNGLATAYRGLSKCDLARPALEQAMTLSKQTGYRAGQARALLTLSDCQNFGDHELALGSAHQALELWTSVGSKRGMAEAYDLIGSYQMVQNRLEESRRSLESALTLWRELNVASQQADTLINLGYIEFRKGAWQDSLAFFTQAQPLLDEKAEPYKRGQIAAGLAETFIESGLPEVGLEKFREALQYYQLSKNPRAIIAMVWGIGKAQYLSGDYQEALVSLQTARSDAKAINESTLTALCDDSLGRTYFAMNETSLALSHFQAALDGYRRAKNQMEAARTGALMGQVYQQQGGFARARVSYQDALKTFRKLSDRVNESATLHALGKLELKDGRLDLAEEYLRQSIEATEDIRRISTSNDLTAAFSAAVYDRYQSYIECLMQKHKAHPDQGFEARAFEISEQARARSLVELLRATGTNFTPGVDPKLVEQEKSLRQSLRVKEDYRVSLLGRKYHREELAALETELAKLEGEYKQVVQVIQTRYPAYKQITSPEHYNSRQIQEQIIADDQTILLEYSLGQERSYVWAVTRDGLTSYELPSQVVITEIARKVSKLLGTEPTADSETQLTRAAHELSTMILSPVAAQFNKRRIIVVTDGALTYVPFQVLPSPLANNELLVADHEIVNAPSASILGQLRQETTRRASPPKVLAAFGDPVFALDYAESKKIPLGDQVAALQTLESARWRHALRDVELNGESFDPQVIRRLPYAKRELSVLRDVASAGETIVAADYDATRERLQSLDLTNFSILHFATHGFLNPEHPENSGLVLSTVNRAGQSQNGFVDLQDIYSLHAPLDLVVLSACQTALGKNVRGEGLISLTRGFMYAGASSVVASLWKVDDEATAELMKQFYTNLLQKGMPPDVALRAAQDTIRKNPLWRAPYYWAAFTLQGEYSRVIRPASSSQSAGNRKLIVVIALLLLIVSIICWWFRGHRLLAKRIK